MLVGGNEQVEEKWGETKKEIKIPEDQQVLLKFKKEDIFVSMLNICDGVSSPHCLTSMKHINLTESRAFTDSSNHRAQKQNQ